MWYWIYLKTKKDYKYYNDYFLPGIIPERILDMICDRFVDDVLKLCENCNMDTACHIIDGETGRKYCPILFYDIVKPTWKLKDLL